MKTDDLDRMDTLARNDSKWPESTQIRADVRIVVPPVGGER